jgi:hypothetical protein
MNGRSGQQTMRKGSEDADTVELSVILVTKSYE